MFYLGDSIVILSLSFQHHWPNFKKKLKFTHTWGPVLQIFLGEEVSRGWNIENCTDLSVLLVVCIFKMKMKQLKEAPILVAEYSLSVNISIFTIMTKK